MLRDALTIDMQITRIMRNRQRLDDDTARNNAPHALRLRTGERRTVPMMFAGQRVSSAAITLRCHASTRCRVCDPSVILTRPVCDPAGVL